MPSDPQNDRIQAERARFADARRQQERDLGAHVEAIKAGRRELEGKLRELQGRCDQLERATRLARGEGGQEARYRIFQSAQARMVGAMAHALKRAEATDRVLEAGRAEQQEREQREREETLRARVKAAVRTVLDLQLPKEDDFEQLFGEVTSDAS